MERVVRTILKLALNFVSVVKKRSSVKWKLSKDALIGAAEAEAGAKTGDRDVKAAAAVAKKGRAVKKDRDLVKMCDGRKIVGAMNDKW